MNGEIVCDPAGSGIVGPTKENTWEVSVLAATKRVKVERFAQPCADHEYIRSDCKECGWLAEVS